jgi:hypothetical protein
MGQINFDAQRAEAGIEGHSITVAGRDIDLPPVLSLRFGAAMADGDIVAAVAVLVDGDDGDWLIDHLGIDELNQIAEDLYGLGGEEEAPNREARRAGKKAKG